MYFLKVIRPWYENSNQSTPFSFNWIKTEYHFCQCNQNKRYRNQRSLLLTLKTLRVFIADVDHIPLLGASSSEAWLKITVFKMVTQTL